MPLFETSTLFILLYAYQKYTGDTAWAQNYLPLLEGYAEYLAANSLYPASQLISVDAIGATANQTALAIQSTIGLNAASIITGNHTYATIAADFAKTIYDDALGLDGATLAESTHFTYNYGKNTTWNVLFASYSDVLLDLNTFPSAAWELQSAWYLSQIQEEGLPFAGPITDKSYTGSPIEWGLTDWSEFSLYCHCAYFFVNSLPFSHFIFFSSQHFEPSLKPPTRHCRRWRFLRCCPRRDCKHNARLLDKRPQYHPVRH